MIRTEKEYQDTLKRLKDDRDFLSLQKDRLIELGLTGEQLNLAMEPAISFHEQLKEEVEYYQRIKRGDFEVVTNLENIGMILIGLRIYKGMTQSELAGILSVSEAQISRDERNEYHGATVQKIQRVLNAIGVPIKLEFEIHGKIAG